MRTIRLKLIQALSKALRSLSFPEKEFSLAPPKISEFGDLSSNIALLLARDLNKPPMDICKSIADELENSLPDHVHNIYITKPGFLNFQISNDFFLLHHLNSSMFFVAIPFSLYYAHPNVN